MAQSSSSTEHSSHSESAAAPEAAAELAARRPGRPRDERAEHAILEATLDLACEAGIDGVTVDAVASRAGVSKATIYRRWKTKEEMFLDAWSVLEEPDDAPALPDTGSLEGDLKAMAADAAEYFADQRASQCLPDLAALSRTHPELRPVFERLLHTKAERVLGLFQRAIDRGEIPADVDLDAVHDTLFGPIFFRVFVGKDVEHAHFERGLEATLGALRAGALRKRS